MERRIYLLNVIDLFENVKKIGKEEANILCNSDEPLDLCLEDTGLFIGGQNYINKIIATIDLNNISNYLNFENELIITHHPIGKAQYNYFKIFSLYKHILRKFIQPNEQKRYNLLLKLGLQRLNSYCKSINSFSYNYLWEINNKPVMCIHTIADICVNNYLNQFVPMFSHISLAKFIKFLSNIPAIKVYSCDNLSPYLVLGEVKDICGNIFVDMLNGVVEVPEFLPFLYTNNINTIVTMHITEPYIKYANKLKFNLVNLCHIPADNLGMNLFLNKLLENKETEIISCGGFRKI